MVDKYRRSDNLTFFNLNYSRLNLKQYTNGNAVPHTVISEESPEGSARARVAAAAVHLTRHYGRLLSVGTARTVPFLFKKSPAAKLKKIIIT